MKKLLVGFLAFLSFSAFSLDANFSCRVIVHDYEDFYLGTATVTQTYIGVSSTVTKIGNISKRRALVLKSIISSGGYFRATIEEVDQLRNGFLTLRNPKTILPIEIYYSPYQDDNASNQPTSLSTDEYNVKLICEGLHK